MERIFKLLIFSSVIFLLAGCDITVKTSEKKNKFEIIESENTKYLVNKNNAETYIIEGDSIELLKQKEYEEKILKLDDQIGPTKFEYKAKYLNKYNQLISELKLVYVKQNENTKVDKEFWQKILRKNRYRLSLYFLDKDEFSLAKKIINLNSNVKYSSTDGFTLSYNSKLYPKADLEISEISYSYILPTYKELNLEYLNKFGKKLDKNCKKTKNTLDDKLSEIYLIELVNDELVINLSLKNIDKFLKDYKIIYDLDNNCILNIDYNRDLIGLEAYYEKAIQLKEEALNKEKNNNKSD